MLVLNRSAIVVKPKEPFLDWLHAADPSSRDLTLLDLVREPTIYLIPECDTDDDVADVLHELCEEIFEERGGTRIHQLGREIGVSMSFACAAQKFISDSARRRKRTLLARFRASMKTAF